MNTAETVFETMNISSEKVISLISELLGKQGYPGLDNLQPAGPWDFYIRKAVERIKIFGPSPEPWQFSYLAHLHPEIRDAIHPHSLDKLNPQPPRSVFVASLTQEVIDRAVLMQDIADAMNQTVNERSIIIVSGIFEKYVEEFEGLCPYFDKLVNKLWGKPFDWPIPHPNYAHFSASEYFIAAAVFQQNSRSVANQSLHQSLHNISVKFAELGIARTDRV